MKAWFWGLLALSAVAWGQAVDRYPEGSSIPRSMTPWERVIWRSELQIANSTPPPTGPVRCPAEYEPMAGLIVAWEGNSGQTTALTNIIRIATGPFGRGRVWVFVDTVSERNQVATTLSNAGIDLNKVTFVVATTDTIWVRDYGPRYIYQGGVRAIVDHKYNRPRPNDDVMPFRFAEFMEHELYQIPLIHGGGNFHLDALDRSYVTRLVVAENPTLTESQIYQLWFDYQRVMTTFFDPFPASVDATQHIDMWMQVVADDVVVVSDWPENPGSTQDRICDNATLFLQMRGYRVFRTPAFLRSGNHYTYTNVVLLNDVVIVPTYSVSGAATYNAQAQAVWAQAAPSKRIEPVAGDALAVLAGVFHCVVMHVPAAAGGAVPSAYLVAPNDNSVYRPGQNVSVRWISDDDERVINASVEVSYDGGATWETISLGLAARGTLQWTVPDRYTRLGKFRVRAFDGQQNVGLDESDGLFGIEGIAALRPATLHTRVGRPVSGDVSSLWSEDGQLLATRTALRGDGFLPVGIEQFMTFDCPNPAPASLDIRWRGRASAPLGLDIAAYDWAQRRWVPLGSLSCPLQLETRDLLAVGGPFLVSPGDGRIQLRLRYGVPIGVPDALVEVDQIRLLARPAP